MIKYVVILFLFLFPWMLYPQTEYIGKSEIKHMNWGSVKDGWSDLFLLQDARIKRGAMGRLDIRLADNSPMLDENTDILLDFDNCEKNKIRFESENYRAEEVNIFPSEDVKKFGERSAGFLHYQNTVRVMPLEGSIFFEKGPVKSFTIDFYLSPTSVHEGSAVFSWHAPVVGLKGGFAGIKAFFQDGRLCWLFENVFQDRNGEMSDVLIGENSKIRINEWHHHALHYDSENGLLTLYYDGKESNLRWITTDGNENSTLLQGVFSPYLVIPFVIAENYIGYIDEFRIARGKPCFYLGNFRELGEIKTNVLSLESKGTKIVKLKWNSIEEKGTAVRVFYRISDVYFLPEAERTEFTFAEGTFPGTPEWIQVRNNAEISEGLRSGKYFQWKAELYGTEGIYTPYLLSLSVVLELDFPPAAPILLKARPLNQGISLSWVKNKESDILGYKVYYGTSSRYYFGRGSDKGNSPIFAGNVNSFIIEDLKNEEVYFISITVVDNADLESGFSNEVIIRPSSIYGDE